MKKIGLLVREKSLEDIKEGLADSQGCFFISVAKIPASSVTGMRNNLRRAGSRVLTAKNTMFVRVLDEMGLEKPDTFLKDATSLVIVKDGDLVNTCKVLTDFSKENETFAIKGGYLNNKKITTQDVIALSKLPSREVLLGMAVSALAAPMSGLVNCLNGVLSGFVTVVDQLRQKKEKA